jgi:hypothetical protein
MSHQNPNLMELHVPILMACINISISTMRNTMPKKEPPSKTNGMDHV